MESPGKNGASSISIHAGADKAMNCCQIALLVLLCFSVLLAAIFSISALASCDFLKYVQLEANNRTLNDFMGDNLPDGSPAPITEATFGLVTWEPQSAGCRSYNDPSRLKGVFQTARIAGIVASSVAVVSIIVLSVELIFCRFVCSRVILCLLLLMGTIGQGLTFLMYAADMCLTKSYVAYPCLFESGTALAIAATIFFIIAGILTCPTHKPKPLVRTVMEREKKTDNQDPCCYCFKKKKDKDEDGAPLAEENGDNAQSRLGESDYEENYPDEVYAPRQSRVRQKSFANAEVVENDLFFDTKTV